MAGKQVQRRRGTTAQHATFTGAVGEVTVDTDRKVEVVHDGVTPGGFPMASLRDVESTNLAVQAAQNTANGALANAATADGKAVAAQNTANSAVTKANQAQSEVDTLEVAVTSNYSVTVKQDNGGIAAAKIPKGTTAQRPVAPVEGDFRFNTSLGRFEGYTNSLGWSPVGGDSIPLFTVFWSQSRSSIPAGFILADGQVLSRATYPDAWAGINAGNVPVVTDAGWLAVPQDRARYSTGDGASTFRMPDLNGKTAGSLGAVVLRGDGAMSSTVPGVIQTDALQDHGHPVYVYVNGSGAGAYAYNNIGVQQDSNSLNGATLFKADVPTARPGQPVVRTSSETRMLNATGCWMIKLFGGVINPGAADAAQLASDVANLQANKAGLNQTNVYNGNGLRFQANFSSGVGALFNRYIFQTSTFNGQTYLSTMPNASGNGSGYQCFATADPENSAVGALTCTVGGVTLSSSKNGSAAQAPLILATSGLARIQIDANGFVHIGSDAGDTFGALFLSSADMVTLNRMIRLTNLKNLEFVNQANTIVTHQFTDVGDVAINGAYRCTTGTVGGEAKFYRVRDAAQSSAYITETEVNLTLVITYLIASGLRSVAPSSDGNVSSGWSLARWSSVFAVTGTINTSDAREKTEVRPFSPEEIKVAQALAGDIGMYQWLDAIETKGADGARLHAGMTAQNVEARFAEQGLDARVYGLFCWDTWDEMPEVQDPEGNVVSEAREAGDRYGVRYDELNQFILRGMAENQRAMESRLAALEAALNP